MKICKIIGEGGYGWMVFIGRGLGWMHIWPYFQFLSKHQQVALHLNGNLNYVETNVKLYQEEARVFHTDSSFADKDAHKLTCLTKSGRW